MNWWPNSKERFTAGVNPGEDVSLTEIFKQQTAEMIYRFKEFVPVVDASSFIHPQSAVTGNVIIGKHVYIGPGAALRGDWGAIIIEDGCNVQENCTLHMFPGGTVLLKEGAHIGHGAVIHGATIGRNSLVGMNSVVMDHVELGDECIAGALCFIKENEIIPSRSVVVGNPARIVKEVTDQMLSWKTEGTALYRQLPADMFSFWEACEPLTEIEPGRTVQAKTYKTWKETK